MAIDTPAKLAILGAGPIGLETALYARFLGYDVDLFERGNVADGVRRWGHVKMFSPFSLNASTLGIAALRAHLPQYEPPSPDALLTGAEWIEHYLEPLSQTDLLAEHLHLQTEVIAVSRDVYLKGDLPGGEDRGDDTFRILTRDASGAEELFEADAVIDATGVTLQPNFLGPGGGPALGELACRANDQIEYGLPDVLGAERSKYAQRKVLVIGRGYSAATNVCALATLIEQEGAGEIIWAVRGAPGEGIEDVPPVDDAQPLARIDNDRLPERDRLAQRANELASGGNHLTYAPGVQVAEITPTGEQFTVKLVGRQERVETVDRIIANVGFRPDRSIYRELQVHECYASEGPMKLAAQLLGQSSADCLDQGSVGPGALCTPEANFYILGSKSYGRNSRFLFSLGLNQIRELFTMIGDRESLDLYAGAEKSFQ